MTAAAPRLHRELESLLRECAARAATDVHIASGSVPRVRVDGKLVACVRGECAAALCEAMAASVMTDAHSERLRTSGAADSAVELDDGERFRIHVFRDRMGVSLAARRLEPRLRTFEELRLPPAVAELADLRDGLVLLTGPTGSGKSTTLAAVVHAINRSRACHVVTLEDPIEYVHKSDRALVRQRELGTHFPAYAEGVRASLREDPDVLLVGEMRDPDTMRNALVAAETGHLVLSTLHCADAPGAVDRVLGSFGMGEVDSMRQQLSGVLRAVVAQRLLPRKDAPGIVPAVEILRATPAVAHLIRSHRPQQLYTAMEAGNGDGMRTLEQALAELVLDGLTDVDSARAAARDVDAFERRVSDGRARRAPRPAVAAQETRTWR